MNKENNSQETILYFVDLSAIIFGLAAISFALYITPYLLFGVKYSVPLFIMQTSEFLRLHHDISGFALVFAVLIPFYLIGALLFYLSSRMTKLYEKETFHIELEDLAQETQDLTSEKKNKTNLVILYLFLILLTVSALFFVEGLITRTY